MTPLRLTALLDYKNPVTLPDEIPALLWNYLGVPVNRNRNNGEGGFWSYFVPGLLVGMMLGAVIVCFADTAKVWVFLGVTSFFALGSGFGKDAFWDFCLSSVGWLLW